MLVKYEYELLSYIVSKGIKKVNGDIVVPLKRIEDEILEDDMIYIKSLQQNDIIDLYKDKLVVYIEKWSQFFVDNLIEVFRINNIKISCKIKKSIINKDTIICIEFNNNKAIKEFLLKFNDDINNYNKTNVIFMCKPNIYSKDLFWIELINNVNVVRQFHQYLINESNSINRTAYREFNFFDGLDDKYVSEIFNSSIKKYFLKKSLKLKKFDIDECSFIKNMYCKENISLYGFEYNSETLWVIKDSKKIVFISKNDTGLSYSDDIEKLINDLGNKIEKKICEFNRIMLFKDNGVLDTTLKSIKEITTIFVPVSLICSLLSFINVKINVKIISLIYKPILVLAIIILLIIQCYLLKVIYWPAFKISKFNWKV